MILSTASVMASVKFIATSETKVELLNSPGGFGFSFLDTTTQQSINEIIK
jgi:hypothetical protein